MTSQWVPNSYPLAVTTTSLAAVAQAAAIMGTNWYETIIPTTVGLYELFVEGSSAQNIDVIHAPTALAITMGLTALVYATTRQVRKDLHTGLMTALRRKNRVKDFPTRENILHRLSHEPTPLDVLLETGDERANEEPLPDNLVSLDDYRFKNSI